MRAIWKGFCLLGLILSVGCSMIRIPRTVATPPSVATQSIAVGVRVPVDPFATPTLPMGLGTLQAYRTGVAETRTRAPTSTVTPTGTPEPTCRPLPESLTPGEAFLTRPNNTVTDTLAVLMLQTFMDNRPGHQVPAIAVIGDPFRIEIVDESINPDWDTYQMSANSDETLTVFFSHAPGPEPSGDDFDEWYKWWTARKWFVQDASTRRTIRLKWEDNMPWRPVAVEGWASKDIFVLSQFGNPWHGSLAAIDVRARKVALGLGVEYWC